MDRLNLTNFIKEKNAYHKLLCISLIVFAFFFRITKIIDNTVYTVLFCLVVIIFSIINDRLILIDDNEYKNTIVIFRWIELVFFSVLEVFSPLNTLLYMSLSLFSAVILVQCILQNSEYDSYVIFTRKLYGASVYALSVVCMGERVDMTYNVFCFIFKASVLIFVYYIVDLYVDLYKNYKAKNSKLMIENSNFEANNAKLIEYQEKIKNVNEQINFQKIELTKSYLDLEAANIEIESQTEVMKYLASSFDPLKCLNVIAESIMEVKKPKICAFFVDKDVYMNKESNYIIKSDYTSMQRRLKKELPDLFEDVKAGKYDDKLFFGEAAKSFRFVGDTSICTLAILPLTLDGRTYGIMIVGSDKPSFFDKGLTYYDNCIIQYNISIKSALLYLKMEDMARKDGLTGIYNRIYFKELFEKTKTDIKNLNAPLSVALFDIDKFKLVNDTYGHLAGDKVIKMVADMDAKYAEKFGGYACRYGGEEFLLVLPGRDETEAMEILEQMHNDIKTTVVNFEDQSIAVNVCIGLSVYPTTCDNTDLLISRADKAMYYGKNNGRGRLVLDNSELDNIKF